MNAALSGLNRIAEIWSSYMTASLTGGTAALLMAAVLSWMLRRRLPSRVLAVLWLAVLVRAAVPFTVGIPVLDSGVAPAQGMAAILNPAGSEGFIAAVGNSAIGNSAPVLSIWAVVFLLWLTVAAAGLTRLIWIARRTGLVIRQSRPAASGELPVDVETIAVCAGLRGRVSVRMTSHVRSPAVTGLSSPVLLVPEGLAAALTPAQWRWTVAHELLHIRRGDLWVQIFQSLMKVLFFFHPAVWLASRAVDTYREESCDEGASALTNAPPQETAAFSNCLTE
jgi:beta-lactamase regulating signal transducer with metallopeptidase domain